MQTVSIALCTYNGERFLDDQLRSIAEQSRPPDEVVVCDDVSTDSTWPVLERFRENAAFPVRLYRNDERLGSTKNFEKAVTLCHGDLIFLCDQDDLWLKEKVEVMTRRFEADGQLALLFSDARLVDEHLEPLGRDLWDLVFPADIRRKFVETGAFETLLWQNVATGAAMAFRSEFRETILPFPEITGHIHDAWIALVLARTAKVEFLHQPLFLYRQHESQQLGVGAFDADRTSRFKRSIDISQIEINRLETLRHVLRKNPHFTDANSDELIDGFLATRADMIGHYESRLAQSASVLARVPEIVTELRTGRYSKYSKGWLSAAKDLFGI